MCLYIYTYKSIKYLRYIYRQKSFFYLSLRTRCGFIVFFSTFRHRYKWQRTFVVWNFDCFNMTHTYIYIKPHTHTRMHTHTLYTQHTRIHTQSYSCKHHETQWNIIQDTFVSSNHNKAMYFSTLIHLRKVTTVHCVCRQPAWFVHT